MYEDTQLFAEAHMHSIRKGPVTLSSNNISAKSWYWTLNEEPSQGTIHKQFGYIVWLDAYRQKQSVKQLVRFKSTHLRETEVFMQILEFKTENSNMKTK